MRANSRIRELFPRLARVIASPPARGWRATRQRSMGGNRTGATTLEYLVVLSLIGLGLVGVTRLLSEGARQAGSSQTRALMSWIEEGKRGVVGRHEGVPLPPSADAAPPRPPGPPPRDEGGGLGGFLSGAADFAIEMSPVGDFKTLMDPNASTFDKVLAGVGLVSSVIPGAGQAVKGATVAIKAGKAANKASDGIDNARDGQRASGEVDEGADGVGAGKKDEGGDRGDEDGAASEGAGRAGTGGGGRGGAGGGAGNRQDDEEGGAGGTREPHEPHVEIRGVADAAHEAEQARRLGRIEGGGEFEFLGNNSQGIEGFWRPTNGPAVPTSLKDFSSTGNLRNIIGRINVNANQVQAAGHGGNALLHVTLRQSSDEVLDFINNGPIRNMPNEGVFSRLLFETADGTIEVTSAGARRIGGG